MLSGAHAPNGPITAADLEVISEGHFASVKLMATEGTRHTLGNVAQLRAIRPDMEFVVRLPDSRRSDGRYPSAAEYAADALRVIEEFCRAGVTWFQVGNEDNWLWRAREFGPWQCQFFWRRVMERLREFGPTSVRYISPPLSFSPALWRLSEHNPHWTLDDWFAAFEWTDKGARTALLRMFDMVGCNCYWQSERQMLDPSYGACYETMYEKAGWRPVVVTEYGCSMCDLAPRPPREEIERAMEEQYPAYLEDLGQHSYVLGAHVFIVGGTPEWEGFRITGNVARAMAGAPRRRKARMFGPWAV